MKKDDISEYKDLTEMFFYPSNKKEHTKEYEKLLQTLQQYKKK